MFILNPWPKDAPDLIYNDAAHAFLAMARGKLISHLEKVMYASGCCAHVHTCVAPAPNVQIHVEIM